MKKSILLILAVCFLSTLIPAQPHPGGVLMGAGHPRPTDHNFLQGHYLVDKTTGVLSTFADTVKGPGRPFKWYFTTMDVDNRKVVVGTGGYTKDKYYHEYNVKNGVFSYDPSTLKYATLAYNVNDFQFIFGVVADQDGGWYFDAWGLPTVRWNVFRTSPGGGSYSTALTTVQLGYKLSLHYPLIRDVDSGDLLVCTEGTIITSVVEHPVYTLAPDGTFQTFNWSAHGAKPSMGLTQEVKTGDILWQLSNEIFRLSRGQQSKTKMAGLYLGQREFAYGMIYENQSSANPLLVTYAVQQLNTISSASLRWIDPEKNYTITRTERFIQANSFVPVPYQYRHIAHLGDRYIQTVKTGSRKWDIRFNFPALPGKNYVAAAGLSGIRPGIKMADDRRIWLNPDPLLFLTANNLIPSLWNPGPLKLDAKGNARGFIDLTAVPALGVPMHMVAMVLDRTAPGGVAFVTEPYPFRL